jgi:hypothetical protein
VAAELYASGALAFQVGDNGLRSADGGFGCGYGLLSFL